jgi:hypothetical protein
MTLVQAISEGTTPAQIEADPCLFQAVQSIACILESLGYARFAHGSVGYGGRLLGGTVRVAWRKLRGYVEYESERAGWQKKLGMVSVARRTGRPSQQSPNQSRSRCARRLPRLAAVDLDSPAIPKCRCESNKAFPNLCRCPSRESKDERRL